MIYTDGTHLVATTIEELHLFANLIGLQRHWFQDHNPKFPHYDTLSGSTKHRALAKGAKLVTSKTIVLMFQEGELEQLKQVENDSQRN